MKLSLPKENKLQSDEDCKTNKQTKKQETKVATSVFNVEGKMKNDWLILASNYGINQSLM